MPFGQEGGTCQLSQHWLGYFSTRAKAEEVGTDTENIVRRTRACATQSEQMGNVPTLRQYVDLCAGFLKVCPDASYVVKSFVTDESNQTVCVFAVISGTHTGAPRGPIPPTGKKTITNYVYAMEFEDNKNQAHDQDLEPWLDNQGTGLGWLIVLVSDSISSSSFVRSYRPGNSHARIEPTTAVIFQSRLQRRALKYHDSLCHTRPQSSQSGMQYPAHCQRRPQFGAG